MSKPLERQAVVDQMARDLFGRTRTDAFDARICVMCGESATEFDDPLSEREYAISGMCQVCQDQLFVE